MMYHIFFYQVAINLKTENLVFEVF